MFIIIISVHDVDVCLQTIKFIHVLKLQNKEHHCSGNMLPILTLYDQKVYSGDAEMKSF